MVREWMIISAMSLVASGQQIGPAFEAKMVTVKIDMPASNRGVDLYPERDQPMDLDSYQKRIKQFGIAVRSGQSIMVTKVKVKDKSIEFHLGGGGYGTFWDDKGTVSSNTVYKSSRERSLESQIRREKDPGRRRMLESNLRYARQSRERENDRARADAAIATEIKQERIAVKRLDGGSRFNINFASEEAAHAATPDMIRKMLEEYVSFGNH
jgi:hypothetical protein